MFQQCGPQLLWQIGATCSSRPLVRTAADAEAFGKDCSAISTSAKKNLVQWTVGGDHLQHA